LSSLNQRFPAIPEPQPDVQELYNTVLALKQAVEMLTSQRFPINNAAVTWQDLLDIKPIPLITELNIPDPSA